MLYFSRCCWEPGLIVFCDAFKLTVSLCLPLSLTTGRGRGWANSSGKAAVTAARRTASSSSSTTNARNMPTGPAKLLGTVPATAYPTRTGPGLLAAGDAVELEYAPPAGGRQQDVLLSFHAHGKRLGRLPVEIARWLAPLVGAGLVTASAQCIYAPPVLTAMEPVILSVEVSVMAGTLETRPELAPVSLDADDDAALSALAQAWMAGFQAMEKWKRPTRPSSASTAKAAADDAEDGADVLDPEAGAGSSIGGGGGSGGDLEYICEQMGRADADLPEADPGLRMASTLRYYQKQVRMIIWLAGCYPTIFLPPPKGPGMDVGSRDTARAKRQNQPRDASAVDAAELGRRLAAVLEPP